MQPDTIFLVIVLIYSVVLHEAAHGYMANYLGDPTARLLGRLTLNPLKHIDPMGSVILPALLALSNAPFLFGWAKPVPYNPYNLQRGGRWAEALVAFAGPLSNIFLAVVFALVTRLATSPAIAELAFMIVSVNVMLAFFNLVPIPPLDGSKILSALLPHPLNLSWERVRAQLEHNPFLGFGMVILFVVLFGGVFGNAVFTLARTLAGV
ncbi:MAG: site-2 protease family protein [Candidatus Pacebacteria bacterium]|nr:site-2 protease family protein [Candidatus Paceibacterota bacterium]